MENGTVRTDLDLDVDGAKKLRLIVRLLGFGGSFGYGYLSADGSIEARIIIGILFGLFGYVIAEIVRHIIPTQRHLGNAGTKTNGANPPETDIEKKQVDLREEQNVSTSADEETVTDTVEDWGVKEWVGVAAVVFVAFTYFSSHSSDSTSNKAAQAPGTAKEFSVSSNGRLMFNGDMADLWRRSGSYSFKAYDMESGEFTTDIAIRDGTIFITDSAGNEYEGSLFHETKKNMDCVYIEHESQFGQSKYSLCRPITNITVSAVSYSNTPQKYDASVAKGELFFVDHDKGGGLSGYRNYKYYRSLKIM